MASKIIETGRYKAMPIAVYFPSAETKDTIRAYSEQVGRSMSNFLVAAAMEYIKNHPTDSMLNEV